MDTSYSHRKGDYRYDIVIWKATASEEDLFCAKAVNMVQLASGDTVPVNAGLQDESGATPDEAFSKIDVAVEEWVKAQARSHENPHSN